MHPDVMRTQEPLWNDTVMRYYMMHDALQQATCVTCCATHGAQCPRRNAWNEAHCAARGSAYCGCVY